MMDFCVKLLKAEWEVNQQGGEEEFKYYVIQQMMVAMLHSDEQLRTERDGDTEKGCQKPAVQQKTTDNDDDEPIALIIEFCSKM